MTEAERKQRKARDNAVMDAAEFIADYLFGWGQDEKLFDDVRNMTWVRLEEMADEALKEQTLVRQAEALGLRY